MEFDGISTRAFEPMGDDFDRIALLLREAHGLDAEAIGTGGGITCIEVRGLAGNRQMTFGTANETWGADIHEPSDDWTEPEGALETDCPCDEPDLSKVAASIANTIRQWEAGRK